MTTPFEIRGRTLARNTLFNLLGQPIPMVVVFLTFPLIVKRLGAERFGILTLVWLFVGYFSFADLGLGRASTKFVAELLGKSEESRIPGLVWTALVFQILLGIVCSLALVALTPYLTQRILNIPPGLLTEAKNTFYLLSALVPVELCSASFRGILEARQRFDLVNAVRVPSSSLNYILPAIGAVLGFGLPAIVLLLLIQRIASAMLYLLLSFRVLPILQERFSVDCSVVSRLFTYGGWVTVCNGVSVLIASADRFVIASLLSLSAVTYYVIPLSFVPALLVLSNSVQMTLFPASSAMAATRKEELERVSARALKFVILAQGALTVIVVVFARDLLRLWVGGAFARSESVLVLQILAVGAFVNSMAAIPSALLYGLGRPDIVAKIVLLELLLYSGLAWLLTKEIGTVGTALAWAVRGGFEALLFGLAAWKSLGLRPSTFAECGLGRTAMALGGLSLAVCSVTAGLREIKPASVMATVGLIALFAVIAWRFVLSISDRDGIRAVLLRRKNETGAPG